MKKKKKTNLKNLKKKFKDFKKKFKKFKNTKGFTLIEVLMVIAIIGVLGTVIVPNALRYIEEGKNKYNEGLSEDIVSVAKSYYSEHKEELPRGYLVGNTKVAITKKLIGVSYLSKENYFSGDLQDADGNECKTQSYIIVTNKSGEYEYTPCIVCTNGYTNDPNKNNCNYTVAVDDGTTNTSDITEQEKTNNNNKNIVPDCTLSLVSGVADEWTNQDVVLKLNATVADQNKYFTYYYLNGENNKNPITNQSSIFQTTFTITNEINTTSNKYYAKVEATPKISGSTDVYSVQCEFENDIKIDKTVPSKPSISNTSTNNWTNQDVTVTITSTDSRSGIKKFLYSFDNITWSDWNFSAYTDITSGKKISNTWNTESNKTLYVKSIDNAGNESNVITANILIDKTKPTVETFDLNETNSTFTITTKDTGGSKLTNKICISSSNSTSNCSWKEMTLSSDKTSGTYTANYSTLSSNTGTVYAFVKDNAGNESLGYAKTVVKLPTSIVVYSNKSNYYYSSGSQTTVCLKDAIGVNHFTITRYFYPDNKTLNPNYYYNSTENAYCFKDTVTGEPRWNYVYYTAKFNNSSITSKIDTTNQTPIVSLYAYFVNITSTKNFYIGCEEFEQIADKYPKPSWQENYCNYYKRLWAYKKARAVGFNGQYIYTYSGSDYVYDITNGVYRFGDQFSY